LEALAGGEVLKAEVGFHFFLTSSPLFSHFFHVKGAYFSPMRNTKRSSIRLKDALLKSGQALPLCLLISHVESVILYREDEGKNLKLVGLLYDMVRTSSNLGFSRKNPRISSLVFSVTILWCNTELSWRPI
jgi:hypothetical protein